MLKDVATETHVYTGVTEDGVFRDPDCIHCLRCAERCPKHALSLEKYR